MPSDFIAWVRSPERTQEELITVERITEEALPLWRRKHGLSLGDWKGADAARKERRNQRCHNPAYAPVLVDAALERTAEMLGEFTAINFGGSCGGEDRTLRAISPLRWMPQLETLSTGIAELADPHVLRDLPSLRALHFHDKLLDDTGHIGACRELRQLGLFLERPWPVLGALAALVKVEHLNFWGNLFALEDVAALPAVLSATIAGNGQAPRDLRRLPDMPLVEVLSVSPVFGLGGIERFPRVRNLTLSGPMEDLRPLTALRALTFAELQGDAFRDVSPLAALPELRWLRFSTTRPRDYSPLAETPRLHEVEVLGCDIHGLELGALHAAFEPWDAEWLLPKPRPLPKTFPFLYHADFTGNSTYGGYWPRPDPEGAGWQGDAKMEVAERRWFQRYVTAEVCRFLGIKESPVPRWMRGVIGACSREAHVDLGKFEHLDRLPELIDMLRSLLASTRFLHAIWVSGSISVAAAGWKSGDAPERPDFGDDPPGEHDEYERRQREQMDREHRFELRKSEGSEIDPKEFAAPPLDEDNALVPAGAEAEKTIVPWKRQEVDPDEEPYDPDAWRFDPEIEEHDFAVHFTCLLTEEILLVPDYHAAQAQYYMRRKVARLPDRES